MNGRDFHRRLSTLRPELAARVVFASGGEPTADLDAFLQQVGASYLRKPFSVRRVLQLASAARSQASSGAAGDA
jgi:CheY-like chemotaxis protein